MINPSIFCSLTSSHIKRSLRNLKMLRGRGGGQEGDSDAQHKKHLDRSIDRTMVIAHSAAPEALAAQRQHGRHKGGYVPDA